jgi:hypothetical protein
VILAAQRSNLSRASWTLRNRSFESAVVLVMRLGMSGGSPSLLSRTTPVDSKGSAWITVDEIRVVCC